MMWLLAGVGAAIVGLAVLGGLGYRYRVEIRERLSGGQQHLSTGRNVGATVVSVLLSYRAKAFYFMVAVFAGAVAVVWFSWTAAGPISTIVYVLLFIVCATLFPVVIGVFGNAMPGSGSIGKLHGILGAFAFGGVCLVEFDDRYELCPAKRDAVFVNGEWHDIQGGLNNWSILWWNRFGMLRYKDDETLEDVRADTRAEKNRGATADGGAVERAGFAERSPPGVSGDDGTWVVDLKRVFSHGIKKIGDIELIETAEEITSREHAKQGMISGWETVLAPVVGLIIGVATGWVLLGGV